MELEDAAIWFVGDSYPLDVEGAVNAGWNAVWMNRRGKQIPEGWKRVETGRVVCVRSEQELLRFVKGIPFSDV